MVHVGGPDLWRRMDSGEYKQNVYLCKGQNNESTNNYSLVNVKLSDSRQ